MDTTVNRATQPAKTSGAGHRALRSKARPRDMLADGANLLAMTGDFTMIVLGLVLGYWFRFKSGIIPQGTKSTWLFVTTTEKTAFTDYLGLIGVGALLLFLTFLYLNLYRAQTLLRFRRVAAEIVRGTVFWFFAYLSLSLVLKFSPPISRIYMLSSFLAVLTSLLAWRMLFHRLLRTESIARALRQNVLFIGWNKEATRVAEGMHSDPYQPYRLVGCLPAPNGRYQTPPPPDTRTLGDHGALAEAIHRHDVDIVVLADLETSMGEIVGLTNLCERELIQFKVIPSYFQILVSGLKLESISGVPIMGVSELPLERLINRILKRTVDLVGAVVGLVLSSPIIGFFGALIYLESPGPIFYRQVRTGRNGQDFHIIKLRSMKLDAEKGGAQWAKKHDDRRLRIGAFLREWNLDEVPQFWNVLKGEMSLVGPRPERPELIAEFQHTIPHYNARLGSKPGITGWAQVNGLRGDTDLAERVRYDLHYLENWSLWLDFQIMVQTFLKRDNAY